MHRCSIPDGAVRGPRLNPLPAAPRKPGRGGSLSRRSPRSGLIVALLLAVATMPAGAQERRIVFNQIEVSSGEAALSLEFSDGERLSITFSGGRADANGRSLGSYAPAGAADREWRDLLARVLSLSDGPLADELRAWRPDPGVAGAEGDLLAAVGGQLAEALGGTRAEARARNPGSGQTLLQAMARVDDKEALVNALEDVDLEALTVLIGRDHVVRAGTSVEGGILLVDGELAVRGRVRGDAIVADGTLTLDPGGRIDGDARLVNSRLEGPAGGVAGEVAELSDEPRHDVAAEAERVRAEVRRELSRPQRSPGRSDGFVAKVGRASKFTFDILVTFVVVGLLSWLVTALAGNRVDMVVRAISHRPARSALVGLAGGFAAGPAYVVGIVVLVLTMLGIPLLIVWVPLFPIVVFAAALVGLAGVSHHVGQWVLRRGYRWLNRTGPGQPTYTRLLGLGTLFIPLVAGSWMQVLPLTGWVGGVLQAAGTMGFVLAMATGFGAVILTRGGVRPTRWAAAYDDFEDDGEGGQW